MNRRKGAVVDRIRGYVISELIEDAPPEDPTVVGYTLTGPGVAEPNSYVTADEARAAIPAMEDPMDPPAIGMPITPPGLKR